jgi:hypothetical protein
MARTSLPPQVFIHVRPILVVGAKPDIACLNELLWSANTGEYMTSGKVIGRSRSMGKDIKLQ